MIQFNYINIIDYFMQEETSWKKSFFSSPGPKSSYNSLKLFAKGIAMGAADIVPGVSGGTVAFITGIYEQLINAIKSFDLKFVKLILGFKIKEALAHSHLRFLLILLSGIVIAVVSLARLMSYLLSNYPEYTWSLFFGLILASIILIGSKIKHSIKTGAVVLFGAILAYIVVGSIPLSTPETLWFIFLSGIIAISAMILPGVSGSFILLLIGKYEFMVHALKNPFIFENQVVIVIFIMGCLVGVIVFARIFSYFFKQHHNLAIALLTGFVIGSLRKIWPWKELVEAELVNGKIHVIAEKNIIPNIDIIFFPQAVLIVIAFSFVIFLDRKSSKKELMDV
jgi:putative membrane protein